MLYVPLRVSFWPTSLWLRSNFFTGDGRSDASTTGIPNTPWRSPGPWRKRNDPGDLIWHLLTPWRLWDGEGPPSDWYEGHFPTLQLPKAAQGQGQKSQSQKKKLKWSELHETQEFCIKKFSHTNHSCGLSRWTNTTNCRQESAVPGPRPERGRLYSIPYKGYQTKNLKILNYKEDSITHLLVDKHFVNDFCCEIPKDSRSSSHFLYRDIAKALAV